MTRASADHGRREQIHYVAVLTIVNFILYFKQHPDPPLCMGRGLISRGAVPEKPVVWPKAMGGEEHDRSNEHIGTDRL
jgi:hypothetical protein